ncbi:MAG: quinone oxidoreductase [Gammaproteobacteria bacterium]|nr:quinone oxidoreductase [Gammaproteobacteria bacterium]MBU1440421.1 quinone oxidoreductase [Gammaproteobacteria bacterium]MBU2285844.1 quinone oxidoreductase [Gammaproteobacteria bacterium]
MQAIRIHDYGDAGVCRSESVEVPTPGPGEVLVELEVAGLNFIDIHLRLGRYAKSDTYRNALPMTLGMEGAGKVEALGADVSGMAVGDRVAWCVVRGSFAEYAVVPAAKLVRIPDALDVGSAAALMLQGLTAHYLAHSAFELKPGRTCLVHAAAGGVGGLLVQLAKLRGATVIATVGSEEKAERARALGADHVILYREQDFREETLRITDGRGVDVVYDSIGRDTIARSIRSLARRGLCINFGGASGLVESIVPLELGEAGSVFFTRPHLADYIATPQELTSRANELFDHAISGRLQVSIDRRWPLVETSEAMRYLEAGRTRGKLLIDIAAT